MIEETPTRFSSALPIIILTRPAGEMVDWQEVDRGPGYFNIPAGQEIRVRIKGINDYELNEVIRELENVPALRFLDLSENRNITNDGLLKLKALPQLTGLNLSSCSISSAGIESLRVLPRLSTLILTYCNHLTDPALKSMDKMRSLTYVDLKGCLGFTQKGFASMHRRGLTIVR